MLVMVGKGTGCYSLIWLLWFLHITAYYYCGYYMLMETASSSVCYSLPFVWYFVILCVVLFTFCVNLHAVPHHPLFGTPHYFSEGSFILYRTFCKSNILRFWCAWLLFDFKLARYPELKSLPRPSDPCTGMLLRRPPCPPPKYTTVVAPSKWVNTTLFPNNSFSTKAVTCVFN